MEIFSKRSQYATTVTCLRGPRADFIEFSDKVKEILKIQKELKPVSDSRRATSEC